MKTGGRTKMLLTVLAILACLCVSLVIYRSVAGDRVVRALFFPDRLSDRLQHERHIVPVRNDIRADICLLAEELLVGTISLTSDPIAPRETRLQICIFGDDGRLFLGISSHILFDSTASRSSFDERLAAMEYSLQYNFRQIKAISFMVDGQIPYSSYYE